MERAATDGLRRDEVCGTCWTFRVYIMLLGMSFFFVCERCAAPPSMVKPPYCSFSHWVRRASLWLCKIAHCLALWDLHGCALVKLLGSSARNHLPWSSTERPRVREEAICQLVVGCSWRTHPPGHQPLCIFFVFVDVLGKAIQWVPCAVALAHAVWLPVPGRQSWKSLG